MNLFRTVSTIRQYFLPRLEEGYCRKTAAALFGLIGPTTPVDGKMFNPQKYAEISPPTGDIVRVLKNIPISDLTQWIG